jgi:uncharacterized protein YjbJ (UPF0337 family)
MTYDENDDALAANWPDNVNQVQERWSKLSANDVRSVNGQSEYLVSRLQERYGYSRERAEHECRLFLEELDAADSSGVSGLMPSGNARATGSPAPQSATSRSNSAH